MYLHAVHPGGDGPQSSVLSGNSGDGSRQLQRRSGGAACLLVVGTAAVALAAGTRRSLHGAGF